MADIYELSGPESQITYSAAWLGVDGYLTRLALSSGALFTLHVGQGQARVSGDGTGSTFLRLEDEKQLGPYSLQKALRKLAQLGYFGAETADGKEMVTELSSGAWGPGDVAAIVAPPFDATPGGSVEFTVDGIDLSTTGDGNVTVQSPQEAGPLILAQKSGKSMEAVAYR